MPVIQSCAVSVVTGGAGGRCLYVYNCIYEYGYCDIIKDHAEMFHVVGQNN